MRVLAVDIGGTNVKILATGQKDPRKFPSGPGLTPKKMVEGVKAMAEDWKYDAIAIGYPGQVHDGRIVTEPRNLGRGWGRFDFKSAFGAAEGLPAGQQHVRVQGRLPPVGKRVEPATARPGAGLSCGVTIADRQGASP